MMRQSCVTLSLAGVLGFSGSWIGRGAADFRLGNEVLAASDFQVLRGKRVGLITNPSGVNRKGRNTIDLLHSAPGVQLVALFGPEHGLDGKAKAGDAVAGGVDARTGLPVHSLYGSTRKPTRAMLEGLDALVYDVQDTGTRSYTYISTMGLAMEACAEAGIAFVVLDRPNPLGGVRVEGPMVEDKFRSFVSQWNVPYVYGLTCGELAGMINGEKWIRAPCRLTVVPMQGWRRDMTWRDTGMRWVATSPNIAELESVFGYPALGLLGEMAGGSGLSIGGGVQRPFQCVYSIWLDEDALARELAKARLPGIDFVPITIRRENQLVRCLELRFKDPLRAPLVAVNVHVYESACKLSARNPLREAQKAGRNLSMLDRAAGTDTLRRRLQAGVSAAAITSSWKAGEEAFRKARRPYLLYPERGSGAASGRAPSASRWSRYAEVTISKGDTLHRIAKDYGVEVNDILEVNPGIDAQRLQIGQKLRVPRP
jgi:uncharacterized protein YbbC (DUF1343 family)